MRILEHLNFDWVFGPYHPSHLKENHLDQLKSVDLPHNAVDLPYHQFDEIITQGIFTYVKTFKTKPEWQNKQIRLIFEGVAHACDVYLNQTLIGSHQGGYVPFEFELPELKEDADNTLIVVVDTHENPAIPPFGGVVDYLGYGGIYREVRLEITEKAYITSVFIEQNGSLKANVHLNLSHHAGNIKASLFDPMGKNVFQTDLPVNQKDITFSIELKDVLLWDLDHPHLYTLHLGYHHEGVDQVDTRFGFRSAVFKEDGFYLNGKKIKIRGLNRHQSYPYVGYAMPKSAQEEDAEILKYQLGVNLVRTAHYPQSKHFLNRADEIGLMVFEEIPGWQHIGDEAWQHRSLRDVEQMIVRDRNHPSIILWGVRINESADDHDFYVQTNALAHHLDPSRQTGGVRNSQHSEFLEDVYTYNDFSHTGQNKGLDSKRKVTKKVPYLISEYNGHMFPTKRFDSEKHRVEHALRHVNVLNAMMDPNNGISGSIGWCMSDYNTHQEFGSGDRVCHHGVLDMFRIPKYAAFAYMQEGLKAPFMEVASTMNIGEYPGGNLNEVVVFTNFDFIKVYKNDEYVKTFYPAKARYPHLMHPPIIIDDFVGERLMKNENMTEKDAESTKAIFKAITQHGNNLSLKHKVSMLRLMKKYALSRDDGTKLFFKYFGGWGTSKVSFKIEGYLNGDCLKTIHVGNNAAFDFVLETSKRPLAINDTYDVKRFVLRKVNQHHELIPFSFDPIEIKTTGPIELIGPKRLQLIGGAIGFYIRSKGRGKASVMIHADQKIITHEVEVV